MFYSLILSPQSKAHFIEEEDEEQNKLPKVTQPYVESEARFWSSLDSKAWILEFLASIKAEAC